ncbi:MAG: hypothetical protein K6F20_12800 [Bacteroidaceae bacterium]|nr:hypothetical protein [Bacteroidaceae bacterium]
MKPISDIKTKVLAAVLTIAALVAGQEAWADATFQVPVGNGGGVKAYQISFGDEGTETGIISIDNGKLTMDNGAGAWYDMSGRKLDGKPTAKGLYIHCGRKVAIK